MQTVPITGQRVILRDLLPEDFEARRRWVTTETEWQDWDAPWEEKTIAPQTPEEYEAARRRFLDSLAKPLVEPRDHLYIQLVDGPLLGWVSHYSYDPKARVTSAGINVCESGYWGNGLGTEAFRLWIGYLFTDYTLEEVRTATWSGNVRMVRVAEKCGFLLTKREVGCRKVQGGEYDGVEFTLTREKWDRWCGKSG